MRNKKVHNAYCLPCLKSRKSINAWEAVCRKPWKSTRPALLLTIIPCNPAPPPPSTTTINSDLPEYGHGYTIRYISMVYTNSNISTPFRAKGHFLGERYLFSPLNRSRCQLYLKSISQNSRFDDIPSYRCGLEFIVHLYNLIIIQKKYNKNNLTIKMNNEMFRGGIGVDWNKARQKI